MLELGKAGSAGTERGVRPVLRDGVVVATLRVLVARWSAEPEGTVRLSARQTSWWKGAWTLDLEGTSVDMEMASHWKGTHRYVIAGQTVADSGSSGGWSARPALTAEAALPLHHQVFMLWLEIVLQRRVAAAAAA